MTTCGHKTRTTSRFLAVGAAAMMLLLAGPTARAETGGGDSVRCGASDGSWNAPNGASVASSTPSGVVASILGELGESYSHIMISHGATKMSHASMQTPRAYVYNSSDDHWVVEDIEEAGPGAATVNMGATYTYLYSQSDGAATVVNYVDGGSGGQAAANYLINLPTCDSITDGSCREAINDPQGERDIIGFRVAGVTYRHSYGVYTFVEDFDVHLGDHLSSPHASLQCAAFQAMILKKSGVSTVTPHAYSNAAITPAVQGLYDIIYDFAQSGGANTSTSANLADQLTNCFVDYSQCESQSSTPWQDFKASGTANSVSPDRIRGDGVHSDVATPWTGATQPVQWNGAGTVYGCWTEDFRTWTEPQTWAGTGTCVPDCGYGLCGQSDGCGGTCASTDAMTCDMCGNAPCGGGGCDSVMDANIGASTGGELRYTVSGTDLAAVLSGGTGDADLYVKLGSAPTTSSYGCRSWATGNDESCSVSGTGTFHILVYAYSSFGAATLTANVASCSGTCVPVCEGDPCGQDDGCGGTCPDTAANTCGMCGNAACPPQCVPDCTGDLCGQTDGCGGTCATTDVNSCDMCGNAACTGGTCDGLNYSATGTSGASYSDADTVQYDIVLDAGVSYTISTCAFGGGDGNDTYLRLHDWNGSQMTANDDACGRQSSISFQPSSTGTYVLSLGCYGSTSCAADIEVSPDATCTEPEPVVEWSCNIGWFDANDGCDCGCTVADPDCGGLGCTEPGCGMASGCDYTN